MKISDSLIETANNPIIKYGGKSNSSVLNKMNDNLRTDLLKLSSDLTELSEKVDMSTTVYSLQSASLASKVSALTSVISGLNYTLASSSKKAIADMYDTTHITTPLDGVSTQADVDTSYGQATLEISNTQEKLVTEDINGNIWIPKSASIGYTYKTAGSDMPYENEYVKAADYAYALDAKKDTGWVEKAAGVCDAWIYIPVPTEVYTNALANAICLHPFPSLTHNLKNIFYRQSGGGWNSCDLTYMTGWSTDRIYAFGNTRAFFPQTNVSHILIQIEIPNAEALYWGFTKISLQNIEFATTSKLTIDFDKLIGSVTYTDPVYTIRGKDEVALATIVQDSVGKVVELSLTQQSAGSSPVITAVESVWS